MPFKKKNTSPSALYMIEVFYPSAKLISDYLFPSDIKISLLLFLSASASCYIDFFISLGGSMLNIKINTLKFHI